MRVGASGVERAWASLGCYCDHRCPLLHYRDRHCYRSRRRDISLSAQGIGGKLRRIARCATGIAGPRQRLLLIAVIIAPSPGRLSIGAAFTQWSRVVFCRGPSNRAGGLSSQRGGCGPNRGSPWRDSRCDSGRRDLGRGRASTECRGLARRRSCHCCLRRESLAGSFTRGRGFQLLSRRSLTSAAGLRFGEGTDRARLRNGCRLNGRIECKY
jgi:hypothetical protein